MTDFKEEVLNFDREYSLGFTISEVEQLFKKYNKSLLPFLNVMVGQTVTEFNGRTIYYPADVIRAMEVIIK